MGAATEIDWNKGDYLHDRHYARLRHLETEIEEELRQRLKSMHVLALLHPEAENTSGEETGRRPADSPAKRSATRFRHTRTAHCRNPLEKDSFH